MAKKMVWNAGGCLQTLGLVVITTNILCAQAIPINYSPRSPHASLNLFQPVSSPFGEEAVVTVPSVLADAARDALLYFKGRNQKTESTLFSSRSITSADVKRTLEFIVKVAENDVKNGDNRLADPRFIQKHFRCIQWSGDHHAAKKDNVVIPQWPDGGSLSDGKIRLTSYATFRLHGSYEKDDAFPCALYGLKPHVDFKKYCPQFTKQDCLAGVFERPEHHDKTYPLVWLSRVSMEEAILQGCAVIMMPDGKQRVFNVHKSNEIPYDKTVQSSYDQKRFWFFKEVENVKGDNGKEHLRIINYPGVVFAGDIYSLGLGKVIALRYHNPITKQLQLRLGVLLDTGGAFKENLYQLDLFAGTFDNRDQFKEYIKHMPNTTHAYILVKN